MDMKARAKELGIRQGAIAERLGVSEPTVSKWLNRQTIVPSAYLRPLASLLETEIDRILPPCDGAMPTLASDPITQ